MRLILASASPRRAELLRTAGFEFETRAADVDERVEVNESPVAYVRRLAAWKSAAVQAGTVVQLPSRDDDIVILGADTAVVVDGEILGKPRDDDEARAMLRQLSARRHEVMTGISIRARSREFTRVETTAVYFAVLGDDEIAWYVRSGEGRDKAGAYGIQGLASRFIPRIEGSYSNVVGLPVTAVCDLIKELSSAT